MFHRELNDSQLRYFGLSLAGLFACFGLLAYWKWQSPLIAGCLGLVSLLIAVVYYTIPSTQRRIYQGFTTLTRPIQFIATVLILAIVYYGVLSPIGLILRLFGHSVRKKDDAPSTHYSDCSPTPSASRYFDTY